MGMARRKFRLGWFGMLLLASVMMFGCGGGGGDDGGGGGTPAPDVPMVLSYGVGATNTAPQQPLPSGTLANGVAFAFTTLQLGGVIDRGVDPISITLDDYNADWDVVNRVQFTYNPSPAALEGGAIIVRVTIPTGVTIRWLSGSDPTEGSFVVSTVNEDGGTQLGPFRVEVAPAGVGVNIYNATTNEFLSSLSWTDFKNAETASGVDHQVLTSLAYNMLQATYRWLSQAYTLLSIVVEYDAELQSQQVVGFSGDNFPGTGAGPANITVQWLDQNTNSDLGPGDGFMSNLSYWWDEVSEFIYNGHLRIIDYWENSGAAGDNYVGGNFRFGPDSGPSDFTEYDPMGNVYDPNGPRTTVGGAIFFQVYW